VGYFLGSVPLEWTDYSVGLYYVCIRRTAYSAILHLRTPSRTPPLKGPAGCMPRGTGREPAESSRPEASRQESAANHPVGAGRKPAERDRPQTSREQSAGNPPRGTGRKQGERSRSETSRGESAEASRQEPSANKLGGAGRTPAGMDQHARSNANGGRCSVG